MIEIVMYQIIKNTTKQQMFSLCVPVTCDFVASLEQDCSISIADALEICQSCTKSKASM